MLTMTCYFASFLHIFILVLKHFWIHQKFMLQYSEKTGASFHTFAMLNLFHCEDCFCKGTYIMCLVKTAIKMTKTIKISIKLSQILQAPSLRSKSTAPAAYSPVSIAPHDLSLLRIPFSVIRLYHHSFPSQTPGIHLELLTGSKWKMCAPRHSSQSLFPFFAWNKKTTLLCSLLCRSACDNVIATHPLCLLICVNKPVNLRLCFSSLSVCTCSSSTLPPLWIKICLILLKMR